MSGANAGSRVVIVGPGAMGCLYAALLTEGGQQVALLDHRPERARLITEQGITLVEQEQPRVVRVRCESELGLLAPADLVILLVKAYDTPAALRHALPLTESAAAVLTLQNGLGNHEQIAQLVPAECVLAGTITAGATLLGTGRVRMAGPGEIALGSPFGHRELAEWAAGIFTSAGLAARAEADVDALLWRKALMNASVNPITALTRRRNGELLEDEGLRCLLGAVAEECYAIGNAAGVGWGEFDPVAAVEEVCRRTADNQSSMLQDLLAGRRTEIEAINGYLVAAAGQAGIEASLNAALAALVAGYTEEHTEDTEL